MSGIMLNEDCNHFIYSRHQAGVKVTEVELREFISQYKGTQVTDFVMNPNGVISFRPSKVRETALDKYGRAKALGKVDDTCSYCDVLEDIYVNQGLDMYAIWIDQCRKDGITPWFSIRMNDCHCNAEEDHLFLSDFFKKNQQLRRVTHHRYDNYFDNCFDYAQEEARTFCLDYICECLEDHDFDGLELDWMREIFCFKLGQERAGIEIMNDFMRAVKGKVDEYAAKRGHAIKISARVPHSPMTSLKLGFDIITWIKEGLVDVLIPAPRWETSDNDMSIDFWKRLVDGTGVELAGGMEIAIRSHAEGQVQPQTIETAAGAAFANLSNGAEKTYLFNYMDVATDESGAGFLPGYDVHPCSRAVNPIIMRNLGSIDTLINMPRRHVVTYHDIEAFGMARGGILPVTVDGNLNFKPVRIETGMIPEDKTITLIIAAKADAELSGEDFCVFVNSEPVEYVGPVEVPFAYSDAPHYAFAVKNGKDFSRASVAEFATKRNGYVIEHVEMRVE